MSKNVTGRKAARLHEAQSQSVEASPELNRKRRRSQRSTEEPPSKRMSSEEGQLEIMTAIHNLNKRFDEVANRRDLSQLEINIRSRYLVRVAPDCNRSYCEDSFSGYSGSV